MDKGESGVTALRWHTHAQPQGMAPIIDLQVMGDE